MALRDSNSVRERAIRSPGPRCWRELNGMELVELLQGYGYKPYFVEGHEPEPMHQAMAAAMESVLEDIRAIQKEARANGFSKRAAWPMIVLASPKGWTGPKVVDGVQIEGTFRAHQVPLEHLEKPEHLKILEDWMKSYHPG